MPIRSTPRGIVLLLGATLAATATMTGCADVADKAGGSSGPVTLRLATNDRAGQRGAQAADRFRSEIAALSHGELRVVVTYEVGGASRRFDQVVADRVRSGDSDLAVVPARAWDAFGVTSLQALQVPFLIHDQSVLADVVDGPLAGRLMRGLEAVGVTGLTLLPDGLRHPFGFTHPLVSLADFHGAQLWAPRSRATYDLLRALGAVPQDPTGNNLRTATKDGTIAGAESSFDRAATSLPLIATGTSNITFFPKVDVLVANRATLHRLTNGQRSILRTAARHTRAWAVAHLTADRTAALAYCAQGGRVTTAAPAALAELEKAARPTYRRLVDDPVTRSLVERIRAIAVDAPPPAPAITCGPQRGQPAPSASAPGNTDHNGIPDGTYRNDITAAEFSARGVPEELARQISGLHTFTLSHGRVHDTQTSEFPDIPGNPCDASYRSVGRSFTFAWDPTTPCTGDFSATWELSHGQLRFTQIRTDALGDRILWGLKPFRKIA
jgi:TRAP-type C4-dicarboxylate transport system substrate-binding protein